MQVYQIRIKLFMLENVPAVKMHTKVAAWIDKGLAMDKAMLEFHNKNEFKYYCFDLPYPVEKDGVYKKENIYTVTIRTIKPELAKYFNEVCVNQFTPEIKGLVSEARILPKKMISKIYTLTPAIMKSDNGYWKTNMTLQDYESRLTINLIKKWNGCHDTKLNEDFELFNTLEFSNRMPVAFEYKDIKLLGDKIILHIADNDTAQNLAYMALGTGVLEANSRGAGFVNYRWI